MDSTLVKLAGTALLASLTKSSKSSSGNLSTDSAAGINVPGTIVANLASASNTETYMQNYARYNNYLTDNYGAAQQASDRYMSLKERIPMSLEYYVNASEKKEILMYINPNQMSVNTQKIHSKTWTRGGVYFHHFGDEVWTMSLQGELGYSQMKGVEALEEAYYYSGALLKYGNINAGTLHTTQITDSEASSASSSEGISDLLTGLSSSGTVGNYLSKVIGTATDALGITNSSKNSDGTKTYSQGNGQNFITKALSAASDAATALGNAQGSLMKTTIQQTGGTNVGTFLSSLVSGTATNIANSAKQLSVGNIAKAFAADAVIAAAGGTGNNLSSIGKNVMNSLTGGFSTVTSLLGGSSGVTSSRGTYTLPKGSTAGNYYSLGSLCASDLNNVVKSVTEYTNNHTINKDTVNSALSDLTSDLTDPYRPRMVLIYFDDRVYVGFFESFDWTRKAETLSISYSLKFTVVRQVLIGRSASSNQSTSSTLKNLLIGYGVNRLTDVLLKNNDKSSGGVSNQSSGSSKQGSTSGT